MSENTSGSYNLEKLLYTISSLVELSESLVTTESFIVNSKAILHQILGTLLISRGFILYYDQANYTLENFVSRGVREEKKEINIDDNVIEFLINKEELFFISDKTGLDFKNTFPKLYSVIEKIMPEIKIWISLTIKNELMGAIVLGNKFMNSEYTNEDIDILKIISRNLAVSIYNYNLINNLNRNIIELKKSQEELKKRKVELEVLYDVGLEVTFLSESVSEIVYRILVHAVSLLDASSGILFLLDSQNGGLIPGAAINIEDEKIEAITEEYNVVQYAVNERAATIRSPSNNEADPLGESEILTVPIIYHNEILGIFILIDKEGRGGINNFTEDDKKLLTTFANQAAVAIENARLYSDSIEKQRIEREIELAAEIQRSLIPEKYPQIQGFEIHGICVPCRMVGGDYLSYFKLPNGNILFIMADVSGKGIPAALLVSSINSVLFILTETGKDLCDLASMLSRSVYYTSTPTKYATAFFAEINPETLKITYVNAGHNPPLLIGKEGRNVDLSEGGFCIGMFDKASYKCGEIEINKDEVLVIYTDGITEQINSGEEFFGEERTKKIIEKSLNKSPSEINRAILDSVSAFADTDHMMDDMTLLTIKRCSR